MGMLISDSAIDCLEEYSDFTRALEWYRMYCQVKFGKNPQDYIAGYEHVWSVFTRISSSFGDPDDRGKKYQSWIKDLRLGHELMHELGEQVRRIKDGEPYGTVAIPLSTTIYDFFRKDESKFRAAYIEMQKWDYAQDEYSDGLYHATASLIQAYAPDEVVVAAFKHLDKLLRHVVRVKPHELYGEELIKRAFNVDTGALQLNTVPNEQQGLRNLVSGAYALFRNTTAHRSLFNESDSILSNHLRDQSPKIVALVDLLEQIVHNVYIMNLQPAKDKVMAAHADLLQDENGHVIYGVMAMLAYDDNKGFSWQVHGVETQLPILKKIGRALTAETGLPSKAVYSETT